MNGKARPATQAASSNAITLREIADLSGVSQPVVSAILGKLRNPTVRFSEDTGKRVMAIAEEHGYRPNRGARCLHGKRHHTVGVLIREVGTIPRMGMTWLLRRAAEHDQMLTFEYMEPDRDETPLFLREDCVDGVIMFEDFGEELRQKIRAIGLPAIWVNSNYRTGDGCITFDEKGAMSRAADRFHGLGLQNALFIGRSGDHYSSADRDQGLQDAAGKLGLTYLGVIDARSRTSQPYADHARIAEPLAKRVAACRGTVGVVVEHPYLAVPVYDVARELGLRIPHDIAVIAIGDAPLDRLFSPGLSSLALDSRCVSEEAVDRLHRLVEKGRVDGPLVMAYRLHERGSSAAV